MIKRSQIIPILVPILLLSACGSHTKGIRNGALVVNDNARIISENADSIDSTLAEGGGPLAVKPFHEGHSNKSVINPEFLKVNPEALRWGRRYSTRLVENDSFDINPRNITPDSWLSRLLRGWKGDSSDAESDRYVDKTGDSGRSENARRVNSSWWPFGTTAASDNDSETEPTVPSNFGPRDNSIERKVMIANWFLDIFFFTFGCIGLYTLGILTGRAGIIKKLFAKLGKEI